jgi:hypothetical protein
VSGDNKEPKQRTDKGLEIPVPKRRDVLGLFRKAAKPTPEGEGESTPSGDDDRPSD